MADRHIDFGEVWKPEDFGIKADHFFVITDDGLRISGYEAGIENPGAVIICLPGIHYPSATAYLGHARLFRDHGYSTVYFDLRAHGESEGDMICLGYREYLDVKAVIRYLKSKPGYSNVPIVLLGLSLGAATAIISAGMMPEVDGVISLSSFSSWEEIFCDKMKDYTPGFFARLEKPLVLAATRLKYRVESHRLSPVAGIKKLGGRPALLIHSRDDSEVPFVNFTRIMKSSPSHVETFIREGNNHLIIRGKFTEPEKDAEYCSVLLGFLRKHFPGRA